MTLGRRAFAEGLGTALLLVAVVGSGIMGEQLAGGNVAIALLANSIATGGALIALILAFGPLSGAHFNPAVTLAFASRGEFRWPEVLPYVLAQLAGGILGVFATHAMFAAPILEVSANDRSGMPFLGSEFIATFGLVFLILSTVHSQARSVPFAVAAWITGAYWFTSSTSFANPAVTIARSLTDSFAGIRPADVPGFIAAQLVATAAALFVFRWLSSGKPGDSP